MATSHASSTTALSSGSIDEMLNTYIQTSEDLIAQCQKLELKDGKKLEKKCRAELKYLLSLKKRKKEENLSHINVREHDLKSSNLSHFAAILHAIANLPNVQKILCPFSYQGRADSLVVDVVAQNGQIWVKVVARKAQALHLIWAGKGQFGDRDIIRQAEDYRKCAEQHPINFITPKVHYAFYNEVTTEMAEALEQIGITVWGTRIPVPKELQRLVDESSNMSDDNESEFQNNNENIFFSDLKNEESDDDIDIPSASELMLKSNTEKLKHSNMKGSEPLTDGGDGKRKVNCDERNEISNFDKKSCDLLFQNEPKVVKQNDGPERCSSVSISEKSKRLPQNEQTLLQVLSSAPVYSFKESEINDQCINHFALDQVDCSIDTSRVNLDITTMITLVSNITHGGCKYSFKEKILSMQAEEERQTPVLPELESYLKGKQFYVCQTAVDDFQTILNTLSGENEKHRAEDLLTRCNIVPDQPSQRAQNLPNTGKIRERSKIIFGTGDQLKCVTVSANSGFVRAAEHQGLSFAVYLHQSRALTERKQIET